MLRLARSMLYRAVPWLSLCLALPATASAQTVEEPEPPDETSAPEASEQLGPELTPEQQAHVERVVEARLAEDRRYTLGFDVFFKGLYQNDQSSGSVWLGNPHPLGDNYSGNNGTAGVLGIRIDGRVTDHITAGGRLETRFGRLWTDWYENGDLAIDDNGRPAGVNATGESLGANHAAYVQLRGLYIQWEETVPIPTIDRLRAGSSDLGMYNAWTVGKIRFIDRDNARGFFGDGSFCGWSYHAARIALPKTFASAGFNTGIADPLVENPFWGRDATYVGKLETERGAWSTRMIASYLLDEEADQDDPDALGSTNVIDDMDGVVATIPRYQNVNATWEGSWEPRETLSARALVGFSRSDPDLDLVANTIDDNEGLSPIPLHTVNGHAAKVRVDAKDIGGSGFVMSAEYFNVGENWVATFGTRREDDVLLTTGFLDGQLPTLNIANELMDFTEPFYETIIGWHGATLRPGWENDSLAVHVEGSLITYNTNAQNRCVSRLVAGCETGGVYPDFLFPDGMTDTDFFTYANTNDRGRDPRAAYRENQERRTWIAAAWIDWRFGPGDTWHLSNWARYIHDRDLRDTSIDGADDYLGHLLTGETSLGWQVNEAASALLGVRLDYWDEDHRSGAVVAGMPRYPDYDTFKSKLYLGGTYALPAGANFSYRVEYLNKDVDTTEPALDFSYRHVVRSIAMLYAGF